MITLELSGGLGNQMFQYALYLKLKSMGLKVQTDTTFYDTKRAGRELQLCVFEGVDESELSRVRKNLFEKWIKPSVYEDKICTYQPEVFDNKNVILRGYWQNERYFYDIAETIHKTYTFKDNLIDSSNRCLAEQIEKDKAVSIHIRRGDYVQVEFEGVYGKICTTEYYRRAISYLVEKIPNAVFYFFSDDMEWVKRNISLMNNDGNNILIPEDNIRYVDINHGDKSYLDMYLMSKCKYHIIANSTFSWWGAWLGNNTDKIVIAPDRWFQNHECTDIICNDWVRIETINGS